MHQVSHNMFLIPMMFGVLLVAVALAGESPNPAPSTKPTPMIGEVNMQTVAAKSYFFRSKQTTFADLGKTIAELMPAMMTTVKEKNVQVDGPVIFVYHGVDQDMSKPFTLDVGIAVTESTQAAGDFKVRKLDAFHCATVLYTGPIDSLKTAFEKLYPAIFQNQQTPTGEFREYYLYWESPESANNVVQVLVGVK